VSTPLSALSREELEAAVGQLGEALEKLGPVIRAAAEAVVENIEPFMTSMMELKKTQPWLFDIEQMPSYDFDGNDLDAGEPEVDPPPHAYVAPGVLDHGPDGICTRCLKPELHYLHDEPEVQTPISIEELEEQAERTLLRGKGS